MLEKLKCLVNISPRKGTGHISQIMTGFMMLKNQGIIDLQINCTDSYPYKTILEVIVNDKIRIFYDMMDGYNLKDIIQKNVIKSNFYFKRSFNENYHRDFDFKEKIYPLGLNYHVTTPNNILDKPNEGNLVTKLKWSLKELTGKNTYQDFYVDKFEDTPKKNTSTPLILFTARTWNPQGEENENPPSRDLSEERDMINKMRAECIRYLKKEFNNFIGGFANTDYARKNYPDLLLNENITNRKNYMNLVKKADICISTMGLYKSNGWKLGEYVAASKAIVSEKLHYLVPDFSVNQNYLEFNTVDECIKQVKKLVNNKDLIYQMKVNNYNYYNKLLRPDQLILRSLLIATKNDQIKSIS